MRVRIFDLFGVTIRASLSRRDGLCLSAEAERAEVHLQLATPHAPSIGARVAIGGTDADFRASGGAWPLCAYLSVDSEWLSGLARHLVDRRGREFCFEAYACESVDRIAVHWKAWAPPHEWSRGTPWWRGGSFYPIAFLFGDCVYASRELARETRTLSLLDGDYPVDVVLSEDTWTRPRWPGLWSSVRRATISSKQGIPIPDRHGAPDACYALTTCADSVDAAVARYREGILADRLRRGGEGWTPDPAADSEGA